MLNVIRNQALLKNMLRLKKIKKTKNKPHLYLRKAMSSDWFKGINDMCIGINE